MLQTFAWLAIGMLALSHWLQVYKIHKHREVRDISIWTYIFLLCGYSCLFAKASYDWYHGNGDIVWAVRQMATILPVSIVLMQIRWHKKDKWHDDLSPHCNNCDGELEPQWDYCPYCSYYTHPEE